MTVFFIFNTVVSISVRVQNV